MKILSICVALFGVLALVVAEEFSDLSGAGLGVTALLSALATWRSVSLSSFLKIFVGIFSIETIVFGLCVLAAEANMWPAAYADYKLPVTLPITVAIFSILVYLIAQTKVVRQMMAIADPYFNTSDAGQARIWPLPAFTSLERRIAVAMVVFLVLINQAQVAITVRLSFFNRDWFDAIQAKDAATFWKLLLFVFIALGVRLRREHHHRIRRAIDAGDPLAALAHRVLRHPLARRAHPLPHEPDRQPGRQPRPAHLRRRQPLHRWRQRWFRRSGYGIYTYSILLISTLSSLVSFAVVLWGLSANFTIPGTDMHVPGFLFWVALIYAGAGTYITHVIGRSLIGLYFERQHMEADFRFSLARLREYSEQVALLDGERAEEASLRRRFGGIIGNWLALINRRMKLIAFTADLWTAVPDHPLHLHRAVLFRRDDHARRHDADGRRLREGRRCAHILHHLLQLARRVQIGGRPSDLLQRSDREAPRRWAREDRRGPPRRRA